jgi:hypothetical protein
MNIDTPPLKHRLKSGIYKHYKGGFYKLVGVGRMDDEGMVEYAVYREISRGLETGEGPLWLCLVAEFTEEVEFRGKTTPRFQYVSER